MNFKVFVKTIIYEPIITWILIAYWRLQKRDMSLCLNVDWFCLFLNCFWHEIQSFCGSKHIWSYNEADAYCVMAALNWWSLSLFQSWLSLYLNCCWPGLQSFCGRNHLWAHNHVEPSMSPLLRTGVIEIGKFQFAWGLFLLLTWKTAADTNFQSFCVKNYLLTYNQVDACCLMTSSEEKYFFLS